MECKRDSFTGALGEAIETHLNRESMSAKETATFRCSLGGATGFWTPPISVHTETSSAAGGCGNNCASMLQVMGLSRVSKNESEGRQV